MKVCCVCHKELSEEAFHRNKTRKDGLNNICKFCSRERSRKYYRENPEKQRQVVSIRRQKRKEENRPKILEILRQGCSSCSEKDIRTLDFHHIEGEKEYNIATMLNSGYNWESIEKEIEKCVLLCANCHRKITFEENRFWKNEYL